MKKRKPAELRVPLHPEALAGLERIAKDFYRTHPCARREDLRRRKNER